MIDITIREAFFDRPAVEKAIGKARKAALSKAGAFVMTRSRRSIRTSPNFSAPGNPPRTRKGSRFRRSVVFRYDFSTRTVVVGPVKFNAKSDVPDAGVPATLEFGGTHVSQKVRYIPVKGGGKTRTGRPKVVQIPKGTKLKYDARPFMGPALDAEVAAGTIPRAFVNSVRG